jgi:hypothetical protein
MTIDQFDAPATGGKITDFDGALLLITPTELREGIQTVHGPSDAIVCDVAVLDGQDAGTEQTGVMVFPKVLQGQLKAKVGTGRMVLGRLGRGVAKPGQSAPWVLGDPTEQDKAKARQHLAQVQPPF